MFIFTLEPLVEVFFSNLKIFILPSTVWATFRTGENQCLRYAGFFYNLGSSQTFFMCFGHDPCSSLQWPVEKNKYVCKTL